MASSTDYDAPRETARTHDSLEALKAHSANTRSGSADIDEIELGEGFELPGAELLDEELTVTVTPMQNNEFRCDRCFLVRHRTQRHQPGRDVCHECA